ncbi:MAG: serine/threonine protein kinase [Oscillatoriophycideae cyanobacterium NC_groundwater_1537_Pr4_S-0.65um_50_18]|nr:serine/threonine protein kinase [Oscillatoriophycideae cyanobacterium NC_groundwater_1537_Pr4_S-0.65um_50_18]
MTYCTNPNCPEPQNSDTPPTCHTCGSSLQLNDRYFALQLLGQGACERTFLAIDTQNNSINYNSTNCVIKQIFCSATSAPGAAIALPPEIQHLQALSNHPQIPSLIDAFEQAGQLYLVQDWIDGQNLAIVLQQQGSFSEPQIWRLLTELLPLLHLTHQHQLIHQDIKPENIIQTPKHFFLVDFSAAIGVVSAAPPRGSPEYAAPEQTQGKATYASDLYSLGVTCIHLLTEVSPFDLYDTLNDCWIWRSCLPQPVSDRLAQILDHLIQHQVSSRFQTAAQVMAAMGLRSPIARTRETPAYTPRHSRQAQGAVNTIALCPIAPTLASAGDNKAIYLWDLTTQQRPVKLPAQGVRSLLFAPDGKTLISAGDDKTIRLWDWQSGKPLTAFVGHTASIRSLALSPDGKTLASAGWDKTVRLWDWQSGELIQVWRHGLQVTAVAFSPNGEWIASASCDRTVRLWQLPQPDQQLDQPIVLSGHTWAVLTVAFSPDSQILATGSEDNSIKLWEVQTGRLLQTLTEHSWAIAALAFSPDGKTLISASWDKTIKLWEIASGRLQASLLGHTDSVNAIAVRPAAAGFPAGYEIFSGSRDQSIHQWLIEHPSRFKPKTSP